MTTGAPTASAIPDTTDPFYTPPSTLAQVPPGTILRVREIQSSALQLVPMQVRAWQLLYRTTDSEGNPYAAVTTALAGPGAPTAILSFNSMIDAIAPDCMPSRTLRTGSGWLDPAKFGGPVILSTTANEAPMIAAGLQQGWVVSVPDLGGVQNRFLTPREPGYVALDGVRAVRNFTALGLPADIPSLFWGYSGGGIATAWAAELQPTYAPELNVAGMAVGAPVADLATALYNGNGSPVAGLVGIGVAALRQDSPELAALVDRSTTPEGKHLIDLAAASCTPQNLLNFMLRDVNTLLTVPLSDLVEHPITRGLLAERQLGRGAPTAPLYVYNAVDDELSTIASADALVERYCGTGTPVTYRRDVIPSAVSAHVFGWGLGAPGAYAWLKERAAGPRPAGCDVRTMSTPLSAPALGTLGPDYLAGLFAAITGVR
ncbi:lipase [Nocardia puris]|nr:lipase family protein [Nocardia puris]MBF6364957.1 lipase [Nocardia puris]MBF6458743.1 lipase [Nocardia puris]